MLKKLYDRCVELARHKFSKPLLGFVAFIESFFFPVPPDLMIAHEDYLFQVTLWLIRIAIKIQMINVSPGENP